ncbi:MULTISPECIES: hypothetical protein [Paraburkholderia]|uniref:Uncharacterized protein n=1 Tax=Paraburkholderia madseniana TaxID=2599607 RepID=A0AAP5BMX3_9BURK|nr:MULTISPECIES: hypothetical protein [Paraburkholderia]MCX4150984.1 hypothetical protein [Paraburkholderia madseniana]MCX4176624.1 hypothetical protein [Paraburkholderia madseniana]MDN7153917.1 hypothetical protein [Paraburkholderia sp. WS6]MDQ6412799.1 hypothetical protein [Paraburkholderia madseniana]MDQ6464616.1 hypothetical protein [Paraburkholderia madseniana]
MATARQFSIKVFVGGEEQKQINGMGKANKEKELRRVVTETLESTGGEVWVTEANAKAWQVWDCLKGARWGTRGRVVYKGAA